MRTGHVLLPMSLLIWSCAEQPTQPTEADYDPQPAFLTISNRAAGTCETDCHPRGFGGERPVQPAPQPAGPQPLVTDDNTLLLLHFDGDAVGASGEAPITATGLTYEEGVVGQAVALREGNQLLYESVGNISDTEGTLELWIKTSWDGQDPPEDLSLLYYQNPSSGRVIDVGRDGGNAWFILLGNPFATHAKVNIWPLTNEWPAETWRHSAWTWSRTTGEIKQYLDGVLRVAPAIGSPDDIIDVVGADSFQLGARGSARFLNGVIDELRISDVARSAAEIAESYERGRGMQ